jgi:DNA-binding helix-hairpin-helix protein with protein kinase domain
LEKEIGSGAEGRVFATDDSPSTAVKIFHPEFRQKKEDKIRAMVKQRNQPTDLTRRKENVRSIAWPQEIVFDASTADFLGYTMPKEEIEKTDTALVYAIKELGWTSCSERFRLGVALNLVIMIGEIHKLGHAIGDFNHENIRVQDGYIKLIDCDGFHISDGTETYSESFFGERYAPPEERPKALEDVRKADYFCLAVHIFQFLMEGEHPYRGKGPDAVGGGWRNKIEQNEFPYADPSSKIDPPDGMQETYDALPKEIKEEFRRCFVEGRDDAEKRPGYKVWETILKDAIDLTEEAESKSTPENNSERERSNKEVNRVNVAPPEELNSTSSSLSDKVVKTFDSIFFEAARSLSYLGWLLLLLLIIFLISASIL